MARVLDMKKDWNIDDEDDDVYCTLCGLSRCNDEMRKNLKLKLVTPEVRNNDTRHVLQVKKVYFSVSVGKGFSEIHWQTGGGGCLSWLLTVM